LINNDFITKNLALFSFKNIKFLIMKKALLSLALFGSLLLGCSPKNIPQTATIVNQEALDANGYQMLIGVCTKAAMLREPYKN
jgi:hypothetical protein